MSSWKDDVRAATTANLSPFPPTSLLTLDGVVLNDGDRVLVKNQTAAAQNGIWVAAKSGGWTRAQDANTNALITPDTVVRVSEGETNQHTEWYLTTPRPIVVGTSALFFAQSNLLSSNQYGQINGLRANTMTDEDVFSIANNLQAGQSDNPNQYLAASLAGYSLICTGVRGRNGNGSGQNPTVAAGVWGESDNGFGVYGASATNSGVWAQSGGDPQVVINHVGRSGNPALWLEQDGNKKAYLWWDQTNNALNLGTPNTNPAMSIMDNGDIHVARDLVLLNAGDCAEDFEISDVDGVEPGTVMVIDPEGKIQPSAEPYDKRVAGVISGAGNLKPGIILGGQQAQKTTLPLALVGKVYCKVDAHYAPVQVGDLLTSSATPGHAMKAVDPLRAFGAVIGKALRPLQGGQGLIPILIALQ